jgi:hypothetical protein
MRRCLSCILGGLLLLMPAHAFSQNNGGVPVRIPNGPDAACINSATDQVWLTLYRVVETKTNGFLSRENQAEIVSTVKVQSRPQAAQPLNFPLSTKVNIRPYTEGQVSIPVEYTLVSGLPLKQMENGKTITYTGFSLDTTLVNLKSRNGLGGALQALADLTGSNKLPIPDTPYTHAATYLLSFANTAVTNDLNNKNADDKYTTASLALNFDPTGTCSGGGPAGQGFETTGTKALLMSEGIRGNAYVPINETDGYCWTADVRPSFVLKAAKKVPGKPCTDASYAAAYKGVTNDYLAFFLQKRTSGGRLGTAAARQRDIDNSKKLCDVLGVTTCPAAKP